MKRKRECEEREGVRRERVGGERGCVRDGGREIDRGT